jgi:hypothetical protein
MWLRETEASVNRCISDYYRCPPHYLKLAQRGTLWDQSGYFRFGPDAVCYGRYTDKTASALTTTLRDALSETVIEDGTIYLPFDLTEVIENLRCERYLGDSQNGRTKSALSKLYYALRPMLSFGIRSYIKRIHLRGWQELLFPHWPVDCSVDALLEHLLLLSVRSSETGRIPIIWFWPDGASSCAVMTHDVEEHAGQGFCASLMDIDDSFGIKSSFQIVPEGRYEVSAQFLSSFAVRGFEVVIHDLNHDGHLYRSREEFLRRAARINRYREQYGAEGFRGAILNRKQTWFDAYSFAYDMSVPNVAHLDPQQGGCCTVMPFFIGDILELPVTTTQDYMLFHVLKDYSIGLWKQQISMIMERAGFISFIVHPDYIMKSRERAVYEELLLHLCDLRAKENLWIATPGDVNRWWRQRARMRIVEDGDGLRIEGAESERARIAYASEQDGRLIFTVQSETPVGRSAAGLRNTQKNHSVGATSAPLHVGIN